MRILALDWGTVRIGAAVSDPDGKIAFALETPIKREKVFEEIKKICIELGIGKIIIGVPYGLAGQKTDSTRQAMGFREKVESASGLPTELLDERFTSAAATNILHGQGMDERKQKQVKDNIAAQLLLQTYLDKKIK